MAVWVGIALASALLFGASTPLSKLLLDHVSPFQLAGLLYLGAAVGVAPFAVRRRLVQRVRGLDRGNAGRLLGAVLLGGIAGPVLLLFGLRAAAAASVSLWLNLELVATAVLGVLLFRDHLSGRAWLGAGLVVASAVLLSWDGGTAGFLPGLLVGAGLRLLGVRQPLHVADRRPQRHKRPPSGKGIAAGTANLVIGLAVAPWTAEPLTVAGALLLGSAAYGASIVLYIAAAQNIGATRGQLVFSAAPFFGVLIAVIVLGERMTALQIISVGVLLAGLGVLLREGHAHRHHHPAAEHEHWHRHTDGHHGHTHPGRPAWLGHVHRHAHDELEHAHPHVPDVHHRHDHD